jgi:hypothetical protein
MVTKELDARSFYENNSWPDSVDIDLGINLVDNTQIICDCKLYLDIYDRATEQTQQSTDSNPVIFNFIFSDTTEEDISPELPPDGITVYNSKVGFELLVDKDGYLNLTYKYFLTKENGDIDFSNIQTISVKSKFPIEINDENNILFGIDDNSNKLFLRISNTAYPLNNIDISFSDDVLQSNGVSFATLAEYIRNSNTAFFNTSFIVDNFYNKIPQPLIGGISNRDSRSMINKSTINLEYSNINLANLYSSSYIDNGLNDFNLTKFRYYNKYLSYNDTITDLSEDDIFNSEFDIKQNLMIDYDFSNLSSNEDYVIDNSGNGNHGVFIGDMDIAVTDSGFSISQKNLPIVKI